MKRHDPCRAVASAVYRLPRAGVQQTPVVPDHAGGGTARRGRNRGSSGMSRPGPHRPTTRPVAPNGTHRAPREPHDPRSGMFPRCPKPQPRPSGERPPRPGHYGVRTPVPLCTTQNAPVRGLPPMTLVSRHRFGQRQRIPAGSRPTHRHPDVITSDSPAGNAHGRGPVRVGHGISRSRAFRRVRER